MNPQNNINDSQESYDEQKLSVLKKDVTLSKSQLLQLTYDDNKFISKLEELNSMGFEAINLESFQQAIVYLNQAENILEYAASCGKTIDRSLIITTLQNQACVYHRVWELEKAINYIQAIIYNISSFLQAEDGIQLKVETLIPGSEENQKASIYLKNKSQLVFYYLQFCAVSSQNQNHETALSAASKALDLIKQICQEQYKLERIAVKSGKINVENNHHQQLLLELHSIKQFGFDCGSEPVELTIDKLLIKAKKTIGRFKKKVPENKLKYPVIQKELEHYSIGLVMQINPTTVDNKSQNQGFNVSQELQYLKKIYKSIYISIAHFTLATELRLLTSQKFALDSSDRRDCNQFKNSQGHHLISIITAASYIPCETIYLDHIIESFKKHYQIDIADCSQISINSQTCNEEQDDLIHLETSSLNIKCQENEIVILSKKQNTPSILSKDEKSKIRKENQEKSRKMTKKNGTSKRILPFAQHSSQKSIKSSMTKETNNIHSPLALATEKHLHPHSKGKSVKKLKSKDLGEKSKKKSNIKFEQKVKNPSTYRKVSEKQRKKTPQNQLLEIVAKDRKSMSRNKSKSQKRSSKSRQDLPQSKQKAVQSQKYLSYVNSAKKLVNPKTEKDNVNQHSKKTQIVRTNNQISKQHPARQRKLKKQHLASAANAQSVTFKFINLKKNKSPASDRQGRLSRKGK